MTDSITVSARAAEIADIESIVALRTAARAAIVDDRGGELDNLLSEVPAKPLEEWYRAALEQHGSTSVLLGTVDDLVVGYVVGEISSLPNDDRLMTVTELYVRPEARGVGVGRGLLDALMQIAGERQCRGVDARALPGDRVTKNFFESFGLVARSIVVHIDLRGATESG